MATSTKNSQNLDRNGSSDDQFTSNDGEKLDIALERRVLWRLDILLVPLTCMLYLLSFLDRSNIGNARISGLQTDLKMTDTQYSTAITMTYVSYILAELPSNIIMRKYGPKRLLPLLCLCWGVVTVLQSQINSYSGLLACRWFLGMFEGGILPGLVLLLSICYRPHELQIRVGLMFSATALSGAFSGLLAAAIVPMDGLRGMRGWQWIFLLEGLFTVLFAILTFFITPNSPSEVITLNSELAEYSSGRLVDHNDEKQPITLKDIFSIRKDLHLWVIFLCLFCNGVTLFGLAYFTPSIVATMHYGKIQTQLMTVPPFAFAFVFTVCSSLIADRFHCRGAVAFTMNLFGIIGFSVFIASKETVIRYVGLCFAITGVYAMAPSYCTWVPNNTAGRTRQATAIAVGFIFTNSGGIVSTWIYPKKTAPYYLFGAKFNLAMSTIPVGLITLAVFLLHRQNKLKVTRREEILADVKDMSHEEQMNILGDRHPDFKYTL